MPPPLLFIFLAYKIKHYYWTPPPPKKTFFYVFLMHDAWMNSLDQQTIWFPKRNFFLQLIRQYQRYVYTFLRMSYDGMNSVDQQTIWFPTQWSRSSLRILTKEVLKFRAYVFVIFIPRQFTKLRFFPEILQN